MNLPIVHAIECLYLLDRYDEINKGNSQKEQSGAWQMLAKIRLLRVVIIWLETFYADFYMSPVMVRKHI